MMKFSFCMNTVSNEEEQLSDTKSLFKKTQTESESVIILTPQHKADFSYQIQSVTFVHITNQELENWRISNQIKFLL